MTTKTKRDPLAEPETHPMIVGACKLLDRMLRTPEWDRLINLQDFDITTPHLCVLGQIGSHQFKNPLMPVSWSGYMSGVLTIDQFAMDHPRAIARLGLRWNNCSDAFKASPLQYELSYAKQNLQWRRYLKWRRAKRTAAEEARSASHA